MGFIFKKLRVSGPSVQDADIVFTTGLNVITGPSDTGKSYIYQCINYMLGAKKAPKPIKEAKLYSKIFLEIETSEKQTFTIESSLKGGNFRIYEYAIGDISESSLYEEFRRQHDSNKEDNISSFFLGINNIRNVKVRINAKGAKVGLSYRDVSKFLLIDETTIMTEESPIIGNDYVSATKQKSLLKYFLTGYDDSNIIEGMTNDQIINRKAKIELLDEMIKNLNQELLIYSDKYEDKFDLINRRIELLTGELEATRKSFSTFESEKKEVLQTISENRSQEIYYNELLSRSNILKQQYLSDHSRLKATIEASSLLVDGHTFNSYCPLCDARLEEKCADSDIAQIIESCELEIRKISALFNEVVISEETIKYELNKIKNIHYSLQLSLNSIVDKIDNDLSVKITKTINSINDENKEREKFLEAKYINSNIQQLLRQKSILESYNPSNSSYDDISTSIMTALCVKMNDVLQGCEYPNLTSLSFSEKKMDFVISGEDRELSGKGYRAVTYSAFVIALQELLHEKGLSVGVAVLDSPLVTYRPNAVDNEGVITNNLAMDFYRYVSINKKLSQLIILENDAPPVDVVDRINYIEFTKSDTVGRYGFFPVINK